MKKLENLTLEFIGGQNYEFCVGSISRPKIEQFQGKTCRFRIQMILTKSRFGAKLLVTCMYLGDTQLVNTPGNLPYKKIVDLSSKSMQFHPNKA